jgi:next to BRCA1 gene 1 protein
MREQQAKRREHMMQQFNAQLEQSRTHGQATQPPSQPIMSNPPTPDEEKARKEAARLRVEHIKAKILRAREEKAKAARIEEPTKDVEAKEEVVSAIQSKPRPTDSEVDEKVKKIIEQVTKADEEKSEEMEGSNMVFPKLDKESPASSTYQSATSSKGKAAYVENEQGEIEHSATPSVTSPAPAPVEPSPLSDDEEFEEIDDDIEVLSANGEESEDDGFLTDEEYDILDASDHDLHELK